MKIGDFHTVGGLGFGVGGRVALLPDFVGAVNCAEIGDSHAVGGLGFGVGGRVALLPDFVGAVNLFEVKNG